LFFRKEEAEIFPTPSRMSYREAVEMFDKNRDASRLEDAFADVGKFAEKSASSIEFMEREAGIEPATSSLGSVSTADAGGVMKCENLHKHWPKRYSHTCCTLLHLPAAPLKLGCFVDVFLVRI